MWTTLHLARALVALCLALGALASPLASSDAAFESIQHRETEAEAAAWAREIIDSRADGQGTLASVFPKGSPLAGRPAALMEYFAPGPQNGSLYMLLMPISHTIKNVFADQEKRATFTIKDEQGERESDHGQGGTNRARLEFWGNFQILDQESEEASFARNQYIKYHPDTKFYLPPRDPHTSYWARFDPEQLFYFGGFGNIHYIGMMDMDLYRSSGKVAHKDIERPTQQDHTKQQRLQNLLWADW